MTEAYADFMIFELEDTGERQQLDITEEEFCENNGKNILHPYQVAIIIKEDLRRIYIWKGYASSVRKKFIASRVASELQQELIKHAGFHRCKVISVDQGEEPYDFLNAFGFKRHVIEDLKQLEPLQVNNLKKKYIEPQTPEIPKNSPKPPIKSFVSKSFKQLKTEKVSRDILEKILETKIPENYRRKNVLTGHNILYGEIIKKTNIFGELIEEREWDPVSNLPREIFELEGHKLRIHFDNKIGMIEAIEVLERDSRAKPKKEEGKIDYNKWTVKELKAFCTQNDIQVPSSYRKAEIVKLVENFNQNK